MSNRPVFDAIKRFDFEFTTQQTDTVLWTPGNGGRFVITDVIVSVNGPNNGTVTIFEDTNAAGNWLFKQDVEPSTDPPVRYVESLKTPFVAKVIDHELKITTSAAITLRVHIRGYEV